MLDGIALQEEYFQEDGLHPTSDAQPIILENIWIPLESMLEESKYQSTP
ncbi:MAG: hypothetical protein AAF372_05525 [Pseudomonadota bacterium]